MINGLLALPGSVWVAWIHAGHQPQPSPVSLDGACVTCDFPFANLSHMCLGSGEQLAS
jgi:hypothetical protein